MSLYGEPHSPERKAMVRARREYERAPKGWAKWDALQRYESARKAALLAAQAQRTKQIARQRQTTHKGRIPATNPANAVDQKPENASVSGVLSPGVQGVYPFSSSYREPRNQTPETIEVSSKAGKGVSNANSRPRPSKVRTHRSERRYKLGFPVKCSRQSWTAAVCSELDRIGWGFTSQALELCGRKATTWDCGGCGERNAAIQVATSCGARICPWCGRRDAQKRVKRLSPAIDLVEFYSDAMHQTVKLETKVQPAALELFELALKTMNSHHFWLRKYRAARNQNTALFCARKAAAAYERFELIRYHWYRVVDTRWGWRFITLTPQWNPGTAESYTIVGLRDRVRDVAARWRAMWRRIGCDGRASAIVTTEISENAHIHIHALVYGPWVSDKYLRELAGCGVHVKAADENAVKEIAKYSAKIISPLSGQWIAGEPRSVIHPIVAARWMIATRKQRIKWNHGKPLRRALRDTRPPPCDPLPVKCASCELELFGDGREVPIADIAREQYTRAESELRRTRERWVMARAAGVSELVANKHYTLSETQRVVLRRFFWSGRLRLVSGKRESL